MSENCTCLEVFGEDPNCKLHGGPIRFAVFDTFGERCEQFDPECETCQAWAEIDRLEALASNARVTDGPPYNFEHYVNGRLMAEGVTIERETTFEAAAAKAALIASRGANGETPVLVYQAPQPAPAPDELEVVAYADLGHLARKEAAGSSVYPIPSGTCRAPLVRLTDATRLLNQERAEVERYKEMYVTKSNEKVVEFRRAEAAEARVAELIGLMRKAHAVMRECGWQLAASAEPNGDGVLELACTEIEADFAAAIRAKGQ